MIAGASKPTAVLIVNPASGRLVAEQRGEVAETLGHFFDLEVVMTTARNEGIGIAADAAQGRPELVIAFGGDGHVNEVVNGVAGTDTTLAVIPGGTMNVFARALGIPDDPLQAVAFLRSSLRREARLVSLGKMDDRYFTSSAGCGFDAEVAGRVESRLHSKRRWGQPFFYWSAFRVLGDTYRHRSPSMTLRGPWGDIGVAMSIACNCGPYAYLAGRPVVIAPDVGMERGLDVFALRSMRIEKLPSYVWRSVLGGNLVTARDAFYRSDLDGFEISAEVPFARHVDGEPLEPQADARFSIVRGALRVLA
jgi:diacylglycerol kinase family enzyme